MIEEHRDEAHESTAAARQDIAAARERMSGTIAEIDQRVSGGIEGAKQKVDIASLVRQHPWPALAAAFVAGVALSVSGADRKAAQTAKSAAKRAPETAKRGAGAAARATAAGVSQLAAAAVDRMKGSSSDDGAADRQAGDSGGLIAKATDVIESQLRELRDEVSRGADELTRSAPPPPSA